MFFDKLHSLLHVSDSLLLWFSYPKIFGIILQFLLTFQALFEPGACVAFWTQFVVLQL